MAPTDAAKETMHLKQLLIYEFLYFTDNTAVKDLAKNPLATSTKKRKDTTLEKRCKVRT